MNSDIKTAILGALELLSVDDFSHWNADGTASVNVVNSLAATDTMLTKAMIAEASPGFNKKNVVETELDDVIPPSVEGTITPAVVTAPNLKTTDMTKLIKIDDKLLVSIKDVVACDLDTLSVAQLKDIVTFVESVNIDLTMVETLMKLTRDLRTQRDTAITLGNAKTPAVTHQQILAASQASAQAVAQSQVKEMEELSSKGISPKLAELQVKGVVEYSNINNPNLTDASHASMQPIKFNN